MANGAQKPAILIASLFSSQPLAISCSFIMTGMGLLPSLFIFLQYAFCLMTSPLSVITLTDSERGFAAISLKVSDSPDEFFSVKGIPASSYSVIIEYSTA